MTSFTIEIPTLETDRLILREPREDDLAALTTFYKTERSHMIGGPLTQPDCWKLISGNFGHWVLRGYGMWHIHHKADDRMIGAVGFIFRDGWDEPELGWNLHDGYEGQGIAFDAAETARSHGAGYFDLNGVISYIDPNNARSIKLATRLGATFERDGTLFDHFVHVYRHPRLGIAQ